MKKFVIGIATLAFMGVSAPTIASAAKLVVHKHHPHCRIVKKRERHHGHWVVRSVRVCR